MHAMGYVCIAVYCLLLAAHNAYSVCVHKEVNFDAHDAHVKMKLGVSEILSRVWKILCGWVGGGGAGCRVRVGRVTGVKAASVKRLVM